MSNVTKKSEPLHLFRLSSDLLDTFDLEDMELTHNDMIDMGIAVTPYKNFSIEVSSKFLEKLGRKICAHFKNDNYWPKEFNFGIFSKYYEVPSGLKSELIHFGLLTDSASGKSIPAGHAVSLVDMHFIRENGAVENFDSYFNDRALNNKDINETESFRKSLSQIGQKIRQILIVLLATKNKSVQEKLDKDLLRGRYNKKQAYRKDYPITTTISIGKITESYKSSNGGGTVRPHMRRGHIRSQHYGPNNELMKKIFIQPVFVNADEGWIAERRAYNVKKEAE